MYAIIKDNKFTGVMYNELTYNVKKDLLSNEDSYIELSNPLTPINASSDIFFTLPVYREPTQDELNEAYQNLLTLGIEYLLDSTAKEFRYDDMKSARAYAGLPLDGTESVTEENMYNEAVNLAKWERKVWAVSSDIEKDIIDGVREIPTLSQLLSELPTFTG